MAESIPQFGLKKAGVEYIDRPGVYGVIRDNQGRIAVVKAGEGYFLPGGGMDAGESHQQAMDREAREECGLGARILRPIGRADQRCTTRSGRHYTKQCEYFEAEFIPGTECEPSEPDHQLLWMSPDEAIRSLMLEADVWALRKSMEKQGD